jgi:hypothetical protein
VHITMPKEKGRPKPTPLNPSRCDGTLAEHRDSFSDSLFGANRQCQPPKLGGFACKFLNAFSSVTCNARSISQCQTSAMNSEPSAINSEPR